MGGDREDEGEEKERHQQSRNSGKVWDGSWAGVGIFMIKSYGFPGIDCMIVMGIWMMDRKYGLLRDGLGTYVGYVFMLVVGSGLLDALFGIPSSLQLVLPLDFNLLDHEGQHRNSKKK